MRICVVALGKIGLPLAVQMARQGHQVIGADIAPGVVDLVQRGAPPFPGEADLDWLLAEQVAAGRLRATTDTAAAVRESEAVVVVVPLVVDREARPDFRAIDAATADVARGLQPGTLVSYETTLPVGTTRERFTPALAAGSGLRPGIELFVCHSPERVFSGRVFADLRRYPKLVGGIDAASGERAVRFYESFLEFDDRPDLARPNGVWDLGTAEAAELAKLAETTYRDVNIAFANELARYADSDGIDVHAVIQAANSQPFSHIHTPGVAVGGHCIPVYPRFFLSNAPEAVLPAAARLVNERMPAYAADRLEQALGTLEGANIAVLGVTYRGGVKEIAFSGAFPLVDELRRRGAAVTVEDPLHTDDELLTLGFAPHHLGDRVDGAVVQADHPGYRTLGPDDLPGARAIVDGRRVLRRQAWPEGVVIGIGDGVRFAGVRSI